MKKIISTLTLALIGIGISAAPATYARVDISGKMALKPGKASTKGYVKNIGWGAQEKRKFSIISQSGALSADKWTKASASFTPEADGTVNFRLMSNYSKAKGKKDLNAHWVLYDNITVEGAKVVNGDFEKAKNGKPVGWSIGKGQYITSIPGKAMVKAWHNKRVAQAIKVKKGQEVTINYTAKADKMEPAKK